MPNIKTFLRSWHGGEISPLMFGRIDSAQFQAGAERLRNFIVAPQGTLVARPGFSYVANTKSNSRVRLLPFDSGFDDSILALMGAGHCRFVRAGVQVEVDSVRAYHLPLSGVTMPINTPGVVNWAGHNLLADDTVTFTGGTLPTTLTAGTTYYVRNPGAGTFEVSATAGGASIGFLAAGSGTITGKRRYFIADLVREGTTNYYCYTANDSVSPFAAGPAYPSGNWHAMTTTTGTASYYEIPTPYLTAELPDLNFDQVNDVMTIVHEDQYPRELRRYADTEWTLVAVQPGASLPTPTGLESLAISQGKLLIAGVSNLNPAVVTVVGGTGAPHAFGTNDGVYITGIVGTAGGSTCLPPNFYAVHTTPSASSLTLKRYDGSVISGAGTGYTSGGTIELWARTADSTSLYKITAVSALGDETPPSAEVSCFNNLYAVGSSNLIMWDEVVGAERYRLYKSESGLFGYIGEADGNVARFSRTITGISLVNPMAFFMAAPLPTEGMPIRLGLLIPGAAFPTGMASGPLSLTANYFVRLSHGGGAFCISTSPNGALFNGAGGGGGTSLLTMTERWSFYDEQIEPDLGLTEPLRDTDDLVTAGNYPSAVGHHQQRRWLGGSTNEPQTLRASRSSTESDFTYHLPVQASDRIEWEIVVRRRADIRHVVPLGDLLALTGTSEVRVFSVDGEVLAPETIATLPQSHIGCSRVRPQLVHHSLVFAGARGGHVYELGYQAESKGYKPGDLSLRAAHLFDGLTIVDSAQSKSPYPLLWFANSDGQLLGLTYVPEEQLAGWHVHEVSGTVESVTVVPEGDEDRVYIEVLRTINGGTVRTIERMGTIAFDALEDWVGMDGAVTYSGAATTVITGLSHLEGETVKVLRDGRIHPDRVVTGGQILLSTAGSLVHVGLGYDCDLLTLPLTLQMQAYAQGRTMNPTRALLRVVRSAGLSIGPDADHLISATPQDAIPQLRSELLDVLASGEWKRGGQVLIRHSDPLPLTLVSMTLDVAIGD